MLNRWPINTYQLSYNVLISNDHVSADSGGYKFDFFLFFACCRSPPPNIRSSWSWATHMAVWEKPALKLAKNFLISPRSQLCRVRMQRPSPTSRQSTTFIFRKLETTIKPSCEYSHVHLQTWKRTATKTHEQLWNTDELFTDRSAWQILWHSISGGVRGLATSYLIPIFLEPPPHTLSQETHQ